MKLLGVVLLALILAVAAGQLLSHDPGLVEITYGGKVIRASLVVAVGAVMIGGGLLFVVLRALWRLITIPKRLRAWRHARAARRGYRNFDTGLLALAAGDYPRAERLLGQSNAPEVSAARYLAAAQAAHALKAPDRRDGYLALARETAPRHALTIELQQIEMQLAAGELDAAAAGLGRLAPRAANRPQALVLRHRLSVARGAWHAAAALLPQLKKAEAYPAAQLSQFEAEHTARLVTQGTANREAASQVWDAVPKALRTEPVVAGAYARALLELNDQDGAEAIIRKALGVVWDSRLVALYGELRLATPLAAVRRAEGWLVAHGEDAALRLSLGRLCLTAGLWGKARGYLEDAIARAPSTLAYHWLAQAFDHLGEPETAARQRERGLDYAAGVAPTTPVSSGYSSTTS
ncbi:MAG: hypothetical protein HYX63_19645 [Gammaproteobacteria bacterium]|nr:hypothetical protein [Gammaproteobacteria bacterium]